jgi:anti-anti-sigma factor
MPIEVKELNGVYVVEMTGELGFSELEKVSQGLTNIHENPKNTVLDMNGLVFLSSLVIRDIVELWKKLKATQNTLIIVGMTNTIYEIFKTTGLTSVLDIQDIGVDEAVENLSK